MRKVRVGYVLWRASEHWIAVVDSISLGLRGMLGCDLPTSIVYRLEQAVNYSAKLREVNRGPVKTPASCDANRHASHAMHPVIQQASPIRHPEVFVS